MKSLHKESGQVKVPLVDVKNLRITFRTFAGTVQAVRGVSLMVQPGEVVGLVGESGCGKSITLQSLMGLLPSKSATVTADSLLIGGEECNHYRESQWRRLRGSMIAMVFQDPMTALNPILSIGTQLKESLRLGAKAHNETIADEDEVALQLLTKVGIADAKRRLTQYPHELSGGMRQRVVIAMALAGRPSLLLADEPTTALDVTTEAQILLLLKDLVKTEHMGLLIISHNLRVIAQLCDRMSVMYAGQVVETGAVADLLGKAEHPYLQGLLSSLPTSDTSTLQAIGGQTPDMFDLPQGCAFHPRCKQAMRICAREMPLLTEGVRCWLPVKKAVKV